ncbi:MAG: DegV family protein [Bacillus subtilis]|nr:DegV family protein [Bacillus subtilis]
MNKIAVITDSGSNLLPEITSKHANLFIMPLMIIINGVNFKDRVEISAEEVYAKLDTSTVSTSLPSMGELEELVEKIKSQGYTDILAINLSSGLSGTFNAFRLAFQEVKGIRITHYDSKTLGAGLGYIVEYALELIKAKTPIADIVPLLEKLRFEDSLAIYTIETLKYLRRGGRIGKVEGTIGDILHIKPIITVNNDGVYVTLSKAFGLQRSLLSMKKLMVDKFDRELIDFTIHYGSNRPKAEELAEQMKLVLNIRNLTFSPLTPVLGIHTGPDMFAYVARRIR